MQVKKIIIETVNKMNFTFEIADVEFLEHDIIINPKYENYKVCFPKSNVLFCNYEPR